MKFHQRLFKILRIQNVMDRRMDGQRENRIPANKHSLRGIVTRCTKQTFSYSKFLSLGGQLWANTPFEGSKFHRIRVPKFYS